VAEYKKEFTILITDDEKTNLDILGSILSPEYNLFIARNGPRALELAREHRPDLILLDVLMPEMSGFEVIEKLKKSDITAKIPVIFITGLTGAEDEEMGFSLGAVDYITKPFSPTIVKMRVLNQINLIVKMRLIVAKEITEKSNRARRDFLSRMSHEMRTPMNAIMGMTTLALIEDEAGRIKEHLKKIDNSSRDMLRLIDGVLDIADIIDDGIVLHCSEFDIRNMVREVLDQIAESREQKKQSLSVDIDQKVPQIVYGDKKRYFQVLNNLLSNAVKFTGEQGSIQLKISTTEYADETVTLQFEVVDNGIGISKEQQKNLFVLFEQADGGIDRQFGGVGSGLFIVKQIMEMMGGQICVESESGKGSRFILSIKVNTEAPGQPVSAGPASFTGKTALLAEDVEINREIIIAMLEDTSLHIICVSNGREALELFTATPEKFDIIIMDVNMPVMDGVEATRRIRALGTPEGGRIPIIALTANVLDEEVNDYFAAGMNDHIGKPVDLDGLIKILNKYLG